MPACRSLLAGGVLKTGTPASTKKTGAAYATPVQGENYDAEL